MNTSKFSTVSSQVNQNSVRNTKYAISSMQNQMMTQSNHDLKYPTFNITTKFSGVDGTRAEVIFTIQSMAHKSMIKVFPNIPISAVADLVDSFITKILEGGEIRPELNLANDMNGFTKFTYNRNENVFYLCVEDNSVGVQSEAVIVVKEMDNLLNLSDDDLNNSITGKMAQLVVDLRSLIMQ